MLSHRCCRTSLRWLNNGQTRQAKTTHLKPEPSLDAFHDDVGLAGAGIIRTRRQNHHTVGVVKRFAGRGRAGRVGRWLYGLTAHIDRHLQFSSEFHGKSLVAVALIFMEFHQESYQVVGVRDARGDHFSTTSVLRGFWKPKRRALNH